MTLFILIILLILCLLHQDKVLFQHQEWKEKVEAEYQEFREVYLAEEEHLGNLHRRFCREFGPKLATYFSTFKKGTELVQQLSDSLAKLQLPRNIKDYSKFLAAFQVFTYTRRLLTRFFFLPMAKTNLNEVSSCGARYGAKK